MASREGGGHLSPSGSVIWILLALLQGSLLALGATHEDESPPFSNWTQLFWAPVRIVELPPTLDNHPWGPSRAQWAGEEREGRHLVQVRLNLTPTGY